MQQVEWASLVMLVAVVVMPILGLVVAYLFRRMEHDERLRSIERGMSLAADDTEVQMRTRRAGLTLIGGGIGTMAGCLIAATKLGSHMIAGIGLGLIPVGAGVALLFDYWLQRRGKENVR